MKTKNLLVISFITLVHFQGISSTTEPPLTGDIIELVTFNVDTVGRNVQMNWSTIGGPKNAFFTVQRSKDGTTYEDVMIINTFGDNDSSHHYSATDYEPYYGISYYRLIQTDSNEKITSLDSKPVNFDKCFSFKISLHSKPSDTSVLLNITSAIEIDRSKIILYDVSGNELMNKTITKKLTDLEIIDLPPGIYSFKIMDGETILQSGNLVSQ